METRRVCIFRHPNALLVGHVRNVLESAGLRAELRNMTLAGGAGELPPDQCEGEVWVAAIVRERAGALVREALDGPVDAPADWRCPGCGELLAGVFDACWRCGLERDPG
ncbi:putative signal transducing protein [Salinicola avicenniae]|uniref:putative signal transducing protein n=1 Tax=Salinicola avicenniae TaxID=2916836 RepID=UPI0020746FD6|nr:MULTISPECIES: DUF2007 domain-containing protein [unclassified Salinicola]